MGEILRLLGKFYISGLGVCDWVFFILWGFTQNFDLEAHFLPIQPTKNTAVLHHPMENGWKYLKTTGTTTQGSSIWKQSQAGWLQDAIK